tara:strand:- start:104 stop:397 length:294 start_codon:yes stop_codon:yes gene_type:complete
MSSSEILEAILDINSNAKATVKGDDIDTCEIIFDEGTAAISKTDIKAKIQSRSYILKRRMAYPSIQDQLDMQYHDKINNTTTWQTAIAKVKSDNSKG